MFIQSALLNSIAGTQSGFGTRLEPVPSVFTEDWERNRPRWKQVHGVTAVEVFTPTQECGEADALFSSYPGIPIAIQTADCVPILLSSRDGKHVAAVHAGWRGTEAGVLRELWVKLRSKGHRPLDWVAAIGPAIGPCCYEVSEEIALRFERQFTDQKRPNPVPKFRHLDLPAINTGELQAIGLHEVDLIRKCTACSHDPSAPEAPHLMHSFRREGSGNRQWSVIKIKTK